MTSRETFPVWSQFFFYLLNLSHLTWLRLWHIWVFFFFFTNLLFDMTSFCVLSTFWMCKLHVLNNEVLVAARVACYHCTPRAWCINFSWHFDCSLDNKYCRWWGRLDLFAQPYCEGHSSLRCTGMINCTWAVGEELIKLALTSTDIMAWYVTSLSIMLLDLPSRDFFQMHCAVHGLKWNY